MRLLLDILVLHMLPDYPGMWIIHGMLYAGKTESSFQLHNLLMKEGEDGLALRLL